MDKHALVTGGAGAIGSRLVARLLRSGEVERVVVVDDLSSGYDWLLPNDPRIELVRDDVVTLSDRELGLQSPTIFHLAAFFANQNSVDHPLDDLHTNGRGTLAALLYAQRCRARRLVYASAGCSIAGHSHDGPIHEEMPVSLELDTPYQITKALGEFYCNYFLPQVSTVRCRFFNSYGPGEVPGPYRNVIPNFIWLALHDQPLPITGTGMETRDFIYVDDLVEGLMLSSQQAEAHGQAINLGTGIQTRIVDLAKMIIDLCSSQSVIEYHPPRPWDKSKHREANIDRARTLLGFRPQVTLEKGLERTVEWFRKNMGKIEASVGASGLTARSASADSGSSKLTQSESVRA